MALTGWHPGGWFRKGRSPFTDHPEYVRTITQFHAGGWFMNRRSPFTDHPPFVPPEPGEAAQNFVGFLNANMGRLKTI